MSKPKKVILVVLTICLPIILFIIFMEFSIYRATIMIGGYHPWQYRGWKDVQISNINPFYEGLMFSIPKEWIATQNDNILYITDKPLEDDYNTYIIGITWVDDIGKDFLAFLSELYDGEVNFLQHKEVGPVYASGACHVRNEYIINDNHIFLDLIVFPHNAAEVVLIICEREAIDEEMIEKIVISFRIKNKNIK